MYFYFKKKIILKLNEIIEQQSNIMYNRLMNGIQKMITTSVLHSETFSEYKGLHSGKKMAIIGAGPSLNKFKGIEDCLYIGLNRVCKRKELHFDYLFTIDKLGIANSYSEFANSDCIKFIGDQDLGADFQISESEILKMSKVKRYKTDIGLYRFSKFSHDIDSQPLGNFNSVSLQAAQFALYTNPSQLYLVGIDCTSNGHFDSTNEENIQYREKTNSRGEDYDRWGDVTIGYWIEFKKFAKIYYPDTEIISINPVGLKGLFKDIYQ